MTIFDTVKRFNSFTVTQILEDGLQEQLQTFQNTLENGEGIALVRAQGSVMAIKAWLRAIEEWKRN